MKKTAPKKSSSSPASAKKFTQRTSSFSSRGDVRNAPRIEKSDKPFRKEFTKRDIASVPSPKTGYLGKASNFKPGYRVDSKTQLHVTRTPHSHTSLKSETKKLHATRYTLYAKTDTSWGGVAEWYNKHLETGEDTYHSKVIFPNVLRILGDVSHKKVLDMACGQGIFSEKLRDAGALVTGVDLGKQLIKIAEEKSLSIKQKGTHKVTYHVASSDDMFMLKDNSFDIVVCILALQNIENLQKTIAEASRVLTPTGKLLIVLNHPSFRNPKKTSWGYNEEDDTQYRRVDEYMSESHIKIDMTPGSIKDKKFTMSFHRPLQVYMKALAKSGFAVTHLEEWISHKESEKGPKKRAEDKSRKEIPMFMCIEAQKAAISD